MNRLSTSWPHTSDDLIASKIGGLTASGSEAAA